MRTSNQLTFTTYEASLKLKPDDPTEIIFDSIDWSFIHSLVSTKYSPQRAEGYDPISLFKAHLSNWRVRFHSLNTTHSSPPCR